MKNTLYLSLANSDILSCLLLLTTFLLSHFSVSFRVLRFGFVFKDDRNIWERATVVWFRTRPIYSVEHLGLGLAADLLSQSPRQEQDSPCSRTLSTERLQSALSVPDSPASSHRLPAFCPTVFCSWWTLSIHAVKGPGVWSTSLLSFPALRLHWTELCMPPRPCVWGCVLGVSQVSALPSGSSSLLPCTRGRPPKRQWGVGTRVLWLGLLQLAHR